MMVGRSVTNHAGEPCSPADGRLGQAVAGVDARDGAPAGVADVPVDGGSCGDATDAGACVS